MKTTQKLSNATLNNLPVEVKVPVYDRSKIRPGIVHIGLGNFHRAHQSWYLHRLMQRGHAMDWGIIGAGVRPADDAQRLRLETQDCMTTLIELDPDVQSAEIVGSMIGFLPVEEGNASLIEQMSDPCIRIVSLTVTEGGYYFDSRTKGLDKGHPDIVHDSLNPSHPRTVFGAIIAALKKRRENGFGPFTIQSCDNLQGNGRISRLIIISLAQLFDPDLANWIDVYCTFPNSMVDCIVPALSPEGLEMVQDFGIDDAVPVIHENYRQWVIEDNFCASRPDWNIVGASFVEDVHGHEAMKIRILNGGHQLIANAGEIMSVKYIHDCMKHPLISAYFRKVAQTEIISYVEPVEGITPSEYVDLIVRRFSNPKILDTVRRVAFDGSSRHSGFIFPVLKEALANEASIDGLALSQAVWARMCHGKREDDSTIAPNDPIWERLNVAARRAEVSSQEWLNQEELYGELADREVFQTSFQKWLKLIFSDGLEAALREYLKV